MDITLDKLSYQLTGGRHDRSVIVKGKLAQRCVLCIARMFTPSYVAACMCVNIAEGK